MWHYHRMLAFAHHAVPERFTAGPAGASKFCIMHPARAFPSKIIFFHLDPFTTGTILLPNLYCGMFLHDQSQLPLGPSTPLNGVLICVY